MPMPRALRAKHHRTLVLRILLILLLLDIAVLVNQACRRSQTELNDSQLSSALRDDAKPDRIQAALVQLRMRLAKKESIDPWVPDVVRLSRHSDAGVRHAVADFMGASPARQEFQQALHRMLESDTLLVCNAAALSLAAFQDNYGHELITQMLKPVVIMAPRPGHVRAPYRTGKSVEHGAEIFRLQTASEETPILAPISGKLRLEVETGDLVSGGSRLAVIEPSPEQLKSALQALQFVGKVHDVPQVIVISQNDSYPADLRELAKLTAEKLSEGSR